MLKLRLKSWAVTMRAKRRTLWPWTLELPQKLGLWAESEKRTGPSLSLSATSCISTSPSSSEWIFSIYQVEIFENDSNWKIELYAWPLGNSPGTIPSARIISRRAAFNRRGWWLYLTHELFSHVDFQMQLGARRVSLRTAYTVPR